MTAATQRRRGSQLENAILESAFAELSEVGYAGFSVEGVAARARTGKASIYRRWPDRRDLVLEAVCSRLPNAPDCGLPVIPDDATTTEAFRIVAGIIARVVTSPAGDVIRAIKCEATSDPDLARAIDEKFQAPRRAFIIGLVRRGIDRGEVRADVDVDLIAEVLPAVIFYRVVMQSEPVEARDIEKIIEQVLLPLIAPAATSGALR